MLFVLICTEGRVSEPQYIKAYCRATEGQSAARRRVEVVPLSTEGNQGHAELINKANEVLSAFIANPENCIEESDAVEKWLVCDFDDMQINMGELRRQAEENAYSLVINKPNFEYFVMSHFYSPAEIASVNKRDFAQKINAKVAKLNKQDWVTEVTKLPPYSKKEHHAADFFGKLLSYGGDEMIERVRSISMSENGGNFTEMPKLIARIDEIYED
jgi:hypothetical protein